MRNRLRTAESKGVSTCYLLTVRFHAGQHECSAVGVIWVWVAGKGPSHVDGLMPYDMETRTMSCHAIHQKMGVLNHGTCVNEPAHLHVLFLFH